MCQVGLLPLASFHTPLWRACVCSVPSDQCHAGGRELRSSWMPWCWKPSLLQPEPALGLLLLLAMQSSAPQSQLPPLISQHFVGVCVWDPNCGQCVDRIWQKQSRGYSSDPPLAPGLCPPHKNWNAGSHCCCLGTYVAAWALAQLTALPCPGHAPELFYSPSLLAAGLYLAGTVLGIWHLSSFYFIRLLLTHSSRLPESLLQALLALKCQMLHFPVNRLFADLMNVFCLLYQVTDRDVNKAFML